MTQRIFVTGASGCVGHYISEALIQETDAELFLLVRDPSKFKLNLQARPGIHLIQGDMLTIAEQRDLLATITHAVLTATAWGGPETFTINVEKTHELLGLLNPDVCERVLYFSTASVLKHNLELLPEAGAIGTDYIRSKFQCLEKLSQSPLGDRITALFPTLVFGGDRTKPYSQISAGVPEVLRWSWLLRFLKADGSFHFIHARDIAQVVLYLIKHPQAYRGDRLVLGNAEIQVNQLIRTICQHQNQAIPPQLELSPWLANLLIKGFRIQMAPWDYFCMQYRFFGYERVLNPQTLGQQPYCPTLEQLLKEPGPAAVV